MELPKFKFSFEKNSQGIKLTNGKHISIKDQTERIIEGINEIRKNLLRDLKDLKDKIMKMAKISYMLL